MDVKVISAEPMNTIEVFKYTGKDACCVMKGYKVRIMNFSGGQEIECEMVVKPDGDDRLWGLRKVSSGKPYDYLAFLVERVV
jgi:hypothetical protein